MFCRRAKQRYNMLDFLVREAISQGIEQDNIKQTLRIVVSNQEILDGYAALIAEQNNQIKSAVAVVISEIGKLQKAAEVPLDTTKIDAAIEQLTAAVDSVESIPAPVTEPAPVEQPADSGVVENANTDLPPWQEQ